MNLTSNGWSLTLDLNGGRIQELAYQGIKVFGTYKRIDGKVGNTHICTPSFDKEGQGAYQLPFHGYARTLVWSGEQIADNTLQIKTVTSSTPTYPAELELTQTFTLGDSFSHVVEVKNIKGDVVPVNIGIHYYWDTPKGWKNSTLNDKKLAFSIETNGYMDLTNESIITLPHAKYTITSDGLHTIMLWTSFKTEHDGTKTFSNDFCCIEPIAKWPGYFGSEQSLLGRGKNVSASIQIKKVV